MSEPGSFIPHWTWNSCEYPLRAAETLGLDAHLQQVPDNGLAVDVGAGSGLSLTSLVAARRPDVRTISVDSGFAGRTAKYSLAEYTERVIESYTTEEAALLQDPAWRSRLVAARFDKLPVASNTVDLAVSYAGVPEYSVDHAVDLNELLRVMKVGGTAVLGPMRHGVLNVWLEVAVEPALGQGKISQLEVFDTEVAGGHGILACVTSFTNQVHSTPSLP